MSRVIDFIKLARNGGVYTHAGRYHADDVFACAIVQLITGGQELDFKRVRTPEELKKIGVDDSNAVILDIGMGKFDHHQEEQEYYKQYPGDIRKSAVAKLWDFIGLDCIRIVESTGMMPWAWKQVYDNVERELICKISDSDTRGLRARPNVIYQMFEDMTRSHIPFRLAVNTAVLILKSKIKAAFQNAVAEQQAIKLADQWKTEGHPSWGFTEEFVPADAFYGITEVKFVAGKSARGGYNIACVDPDKFPIPQDLKEAKRKGLYWANFESKEAALAAVEKIAVNYGLQDRMKIYGDKPNQEAKEKKPLMSVGPDGVIKIDPKVFKELFGIDPVKIAKRIEENIRIDEEISRYLDTKEEK